MNNSTIFVGIASYRDDELVPTLLDMFDKAAQPERLHIAVCWQDNGDLSPFINQGFVSQSLGEHQGHLLYRLTKGNAAFQLLAVEYLKGQGPCWARHTCNTLFRGERYHLQIDSHSRFIPNWDSEMIAMLESLRAQSLRPVLTHYPPPYTPGQDVVKRSQKVSRLIFNQFNAKGILSLKSANMDEEKPRPGGYLAAGLIFCDGHFIENVPYDPQLFFVGEEISLAARAYTHGYDLYTPNKPLIWHYYSRCSAPKFWQDHTGDAKNKGEVEETWWARDARSVQRIRSLLNIDDEPVELGHYGLGTQRSLQEFQHRIGIDFRQQRVHHRVCSEEQMSWFDPLPVSSGLWQQQLLYPHQRMWKLKHTEVNVERTDVLWWQLSVYRADNTTLMNQQLSSEAIKKLIQHDDGESFELKVHFHITSPVTAHSMRLCPYIAGEGWGEIRERAW